MAGRQDVLRALVQSGASTLRRDGDPDGRTPIEVALAEGRTDIAEALLELGAEEELADSQVAEKFAQEPGDSLLHMAAWGRVVGHCRMLLQAGADVNSMNGLMRSPLHIAAVQGPTELMLLLLEACWDGGEHARGGRGQGRGQRRGQAAGRWPRLRGRRSPPRAVPQRSRSALAFDGWSDPCRCLMPPRTARALRLELCPTCRTAPAARPCTWLAPPTLAATMRTMRVKAPLKRHSC